MGVEAGSDTLGEGGMEGEGKQQVDQVDQVDQVEG